MPRKRIDLVGEQFALLTVIEYLGHNKHGHNIYLCKCECGNNKVVTSSDFRYGRIKSCGCAKFDIGKMRRTHAMTKTKLYKTWSDMKSRCYNKKNKSYKDYGGRGITVCELWKNNFQNFLVWSNKVGYREELELDRIDFNLNYEPSNCRFVSEAIQASNKHYHNHSTNLRGIYKTKYNAYAVCISRNRKKIYIGTFKDLNEAIKKYEEAIILHPIK